MNAPSTPTPNARRSPSGDETIARALEPYRHRLRRSVELRLDARLRARLDASDIVQEALVEAIRRYGEFDEERSGSLYLWLRFLAHQRLLQLHRRHLAAAKRTVEREVRIGESSCAALAEHVVTSGVLSPSSVCSLQETRRIVLAALESLDPLDRETLALRYFEELSNVETARVLGINESTASTRFVRALRRFRSALDGLEESLRGP